MGLFFSSESEILKQEISEKLEEIDKQLSEHQARISWNKQKILLRQKKNCEQRDEQSAMRNASDILVLEQENALRTTQIHRLNELRRQLIECELTIEHDDSLRKVRELLDQIKVREAAPPLTAEEKKVLLEKDAQLLSETLPEVPGMRETKPQNVENADKNRTAEPQNVPVEVDQVQVVAEVEIVTNPVRAQASTQTNNDQGAVL